MSGHPSQRTTRRRHADLVRHMNAARTVSDAFAAGSARLRELVPHDAAAWLMADPETGLPSAPSHIEGLSVSVEVCTEHWQQEFLTPDINRFHDLARADRPAASLRRASPNLSRSARYRRFMRPLGLGDELRTVLRIGGTAWGTITLWRSEDRPAFSATETLALARLSRPIADVVRARVREGPTDLGGAGPEQPGLLVFDADGTLVSVSPAAVEWLKELPQQDLVTTRLGLRVPLWLLVTATRAHTSLLDGGPGTSQTRVRSRGGRWLVGRASTTRALDGEPATTVVTLESAGPGLMAPVLAGLYGLTEREQEIARHLARGASTDEIARSLYLSPHTVRDYVKAIFAKVGTSSRGELVARLYTDLRDAR